MDAITPADPFAAFVTEAGQRFRFPVSWIGAVMRAESAGDVRAVSSAGAMGLMQIMPKTWSHLRARHRLGLDPHEDLGALEGSARQKFGAPAKSEFVVQQVHTSKDRSNR
jgi:hypothetical protein